MTGVVDVFFLPVAQVGPEYLFPQEQVKLSNVVALHGALLAHGPESQAVRAGKQQYSLDNNKYRIQQLKLR